MSNEGYQRAEERIEAAYRSQATELDLSAALNEDLALAELPESLKRLTQLKFLVLTRNDLTELPPWIGQLTNLKALDLSENQLVTLPDSFGELKQLESLNLTFNELDTLPEFLVQLTNLESLGLSNLPLKDVPEGLSNLTRLRSLDLSGTDLEEIPSWLGRLRKLETLDLSDGQFRMLPDTLNRLTALNRLDLSINQLTNLPEWLGDLTELRRLELYQNKLKSLPASLEKLTKLQYLNLSHNQLGALPDSVGELTQLHWLYISNNKLRSLPETMGGLTQLENLDLQDNKLRAIPFSFGKLTSLARMDIGNNELTSLPESLLNLPALRHLFLHGNTSLGIPEEVLGATHFNVYLGHKAADPHIILTYYFAQQQRNAKPLNEVKLLLVGHGRVGKTSLSKALRGIPHDKHEPETPGIERHALKLGAREPTITAHIWDFGGQEFLHQTHQFFFSRRSIYLVVLGGRHRQPMAEAEYWLRLIRAYGSGSPVVIALNKIKEHPFTIDEYFLQENYPEVKAVIKTDCDPRVGIDGLRKLLGKLAGEMPSVREKIAPAWARVRTRLEEMNTSFVSFAEYREICSQEGVKTAENQETLATILDCLGIALNYRDDPRLRDTSVLKPRWLVDGIYKILRWLHKNETNGQMTLADFPKALRSKKEYPSHMHQFLMALMEKFELCFPLDNEEGVYLVPGLLSENQPRDFKDLMTQNAQRIQLRYDDVRPPGLLPRFIVRSHTLSEKQPRWLRGVVLTRRSARALVRGDHEGRVTDIFATGVNADDRVWLTEFILSEMRILNERLRARTFVEDQPGVWTELEILRDAAQRDETTRAERSADGGTVMVNVMQRLREVESAEASTPRGDPLSLFICYAHANERVVKRLIPSIKVLARRGYIAAWQDTDLVPGEDWDETIKQRLSESQIVLFMVSRDFLASPYITEHERPLAMKLMDQKKAVVVPVLLSKCSWQDEDFAKLEKLPRKDELISSINPREDAWALVEEGLKRVVEKVRPFQASHHKLSQD